MSLHRIISSALSGPIITLALTLASTATATAQDLPGFGDSEARPTGTPFKLPEGLELTVVSYNPFDPDTCKRPDADPAEEAPPAQGLAAGQVNLCLQFRNTTRQRIDVDLPPGLVWISSSQENQNGMFFERMQLEVPSEQYLFAPIKGDCLNPSRSAPGPGIPYEIGPLTDSRDIREALGLMAGADLSDPMVSATASMLMKPLYAGKPLTQETRRDLMELPRRQG